MPLNASPTEQPGERDPTCTPPTSSPALTLPAPSFEATASRAEQHGPSNRKRRPSKALVPRLIEPRAPSVRGDVLRGVDSLSLRRHSARPARELLLLALWLCSSASGPLVHTCARWALLLAPRPVRPHTHTQPPHTPRGRWGSARTPVRRRVGGRLRKPPWRHRNAPICAPVQPWRLALCSGGPGLRRRLQRQSFRPPALRHCACILQRHGVQRALPDPPRASCRVCDICRSGFPPYPGPPRTRTTRRP